MLSLSLRAIILLSAFGKIPSISAREAAIQDIETDYTKKCIEESARNPERQPEVCLKNKMFTG